MPECSISQLSTFEECALQYRLIYVDRIKRYEEGVEAFLGRGFIEDYYKRHHPFDEGLGKRSEFQRIRPCPRISGFLLQF